MTSQNLKFYKFNNSTTSAGKITTAKAVEGAIIYLVDVRELWIGGSTPKLVIKGANDVTFANNVLTLTHYDNDGVASTQTLDFSDVASSSATLKVFEKVYNMIGATDNQAGTAKELNYSGTNYLAELGQEGKPAKNLVNADKALDAAIHDLATGKVSDVKINTVSIKDNNGVADIAVEGTYDATDNKIATESTVSDAIKELDTQADVQPVVYTAADSSNGAKLTFKGVSETDGVIAQGSGNTELQFAKVATSGDAADVDYTNTSSQMTATDVQGAIDELDNRIDALEGSFDVIKSINAATTPAGVTWEDTSTEPATTVTGSLAASDATFHKIYLVPVDSTGTNKYAEYITVKDTSGQTTTYAWERLGTIDVDLNGYVKTITLNGKQYAVDNNGSVNVTLDDVITGVTGEIAISGGDTNYVKVAANTVKDTTNGTNVTTLSTTVQLEEVADALTKDNQATYASGHYVIENGKLVSAENKSTGDTYTIANNGLTTAADVAAYVESKTGEGISSLDADITSDDKAVATVEVKEVDGKITDVVVTNVSAGVTYTPSEHAGGSTGASADLAAGSSADAQAGAVTGADIAAIKNYVDDKSTLCWEEYE